MDNNGEEMTYWSERRANEMYESRDRSIAEECNRLAAEERQRMTLFAMLKPKVLQDGDKFCILYGDDIASGIVGFGKTIHEAVDDFTAQFDKLVKSGATNEHCLGDTSRMG